MEAEVDPTTHEVYAMDMSCLKRDLPEAFHDPVRLGSFDEKPIKSRMEKSSVECKVGRFARTAGQKL